MELPLVDQIIVAVYLGGLLVFGLQFRRFVRSERDYFLAGRSLPFWAIGMSIVVSDIGAIDFVSLSSASYKHGIAAANMDWIGTMPAILIAAFVFMPYFWRAGVYSVPEFLGMRYNPTVRAIQAVAWTTFLVFNLGAIFWATAGMFDELLGPEALSSFIDVPDDGAKPAVIRNAEIARRMVYVVGTALFTGLYTVSGGLAAVVYTDAIQMVIMFVGAFLILGIGLWHPEKGVGGFAELKDGIESTHPDHFRLLLPHDSKSPFPWTGVLFGLALVQAPAYFVGNQAIVQRTLGARDEWNAKAGALFGGFLKFFIPVLVVLPGLLALRLYPELEDPEKGFARLVKDLLPMGVRGIVFAGFLAAMMSSVDSVVTSAATLITRDFWVGLFHARPSDRALLRTGRIVTFALMVFGVLMASTLHPDFRIFSGIYEAIQDTLAIIQGPTWALLIVGIFWRRATAAAGTIALLGGLATSIGLTLWDKVAVAASAAREDPEASSVLLDAWRSLGGGDSIEPPFHSEDPFMFIAAVSCAVSIGLLVAVSFATRPKSPEALRGLVYRSVLRDPEAQDALRRRLDDDDDAGDEGTREGGER